MGLYQQIRIWNRAQRYRRKGEPDECRFTSDCISPGQIALDIGAHKAAFTYWMSRAVGPSGRVYAFEPQPALARYLEGFAESAAHQNVTVCPVALSDQRQQGKLVIPATHLGWAQLQDGDGSGTESTIDVPVETLDAYLDAIGAARPVSFVKCDVELHELFVFRGGQELLKQDRPLLLFESVPLADRPIDQNETFTFLQQLGYQGFFFYDARLVPVEQYSSTRYPKAKECVQNYVFIHPLAAMLTSFQPPYSVAWTSVAASRAAGISLRNAS